MSGVARVRAWLRFVAASLSLEGCLVGQTEFRSNLDASDEPSLPSEASTDATDSAMSTHITHSAPSIAKDLKSAINEKRPPCIVTSLRAPAGGRANVQFVGGFAERDATGRGSVSTSTAVFCNSRMTTVA